MYNILNLFHLQVRRATVHLNTGTLLATLMQASSALLRNLLGKRRTKIDQDLHHLSLKHSVQRRTVRVYLHPRYHILRCITLAARTVYRLVIFQGVYHRHMGIHSHIAAVIRLQRVYTQEANSTEDQAIRQYMARGKETEPTLTISSRVAGQSMLSCDEPEERVILLPGCTLCAALTAAPRRQISINSHASIRVSVCIPVAPPVCVSHTSVDVMPVLQSVFHVSCLQKAAVKLHLSSVLRKQNIFLELGCDFHCSNFVFLSPSLHSLYTCCFSPNMDAVLFNYPFFQEVEVLLLLI